jgi:hypothetical protein
VEIQTVTRLSRVHDTYLTTTVHLSPQAASAFKNGDTAAVGEKGVGMVKARLAAVLAVLLAAAAAGTALWPSWIEGLTGLQPDGGSGESEWWLVAVLGLAALVSALYGRWLAVEARIPSATTVTSDG